MGARVKFSGFPCFVFPTIAADYRKWVLIMKARAASTEHGEKHALWKLGAGFEVRTAGPPCHGHGGATNLSYCHINQYSSVFFRLLSLFCFVLYVKQGLAMQFGIALNSLCSLGWPQTRTLNDLPASTSQVLGLQACVPPLPVLDYFLTL